MSLHEELCKEFSAPLTKSENELLEKIEILLDEAEQDGMSKIGISKVLDQLDFLHQVWVKKDA